MGSGPRVGAGASPYTGWRRPSIPVSRSQTTLSVLVRPRSVPGALAAAWAMRPRRGSGAVLPVPDRRYWAWRLHTAYGSGDPDPADVAPLVAWRRRLRVLR